jgi:hypothetical protein
MVPYKCEIGWFHSETLPDPLLSDVCNALGIKIHIGAMPVLGAVIGRDIPKMQTMVKQKIQEDIKDLQVLDTHELKIQELMLLLRTCLVRRPTHLMRACPPDVMGPALETYDNAVFDILQKILSLDLSGSMATRLQTTLPTRQAGLGVPCLAPLAPLAWLAAQAEAAKYMDPQQDPVHLTRTTQALEQAQRLLKPEDRKKLLHGGKCACAPTMCTAPSENSVQSLRIQAR